MTILVVTVLLLLSFAVMAYPFVAPRSRTANLAEPGEEFATQLRRARDRVYEEIRALQQEYFLNNLTEEEYQQQLQTARRRAANLIRRQHQVQETLNAVEAEIDAQLEEAAARAREEEAAGEQPVTRQRG